MLTHQNKAKHTKKNQIGTDLKQGISLVLRIRFKNLILKFFGEKKKKKKSSVEWFRPVLLVKKSQEKKIWRGECSNVPKKSKSGVGKKKSCVPCACGASSSHQRSSILWEHFLKMLRTVASPGTFGHHDRCLLIRRLTPTTACGRPPKSTTYSMVRGKSKCR